MPAPTAPLTLGEPPIPVTLRRSGRARRLSLRVCAADGRVTLTLPRRLPLGEALAFLRSREDWVRRALLAAPAPLLPDWGAAIPFEGGTLRLLPGEGRRATRDGDALRLPPGDPARPLGAWLKAEARARARAACDRHAAALGRPYTALSLRDPRSRWGSCSSGGRLMLSWRLVLAPPDVLDYVAAHEVAHLARMDHSPAFWAVVERLRPDWRASRDWLRTQGAALHRLRVD